MRNGSKEMTRNETSADGDGTQSYDPHTPFLHYIHTNLVTSKCPFSLVLFEFRMKLRGVFVTPQSQGVFFFF